MIRFLIRNDDVSFDTSIEEIKSFCEICDKHGYKIIQAITLAGECQKTHATMTNDEIRMASFKRFEENKEVVEYLRSREDYIAVHGLWHTHSPTNEEIVKAKELLNELGFNPTYFVPPFNEGNYSEEVAGLKLCQLSLEKGENLETFLRGGEPTSPIMYLHSWRFQNHKFGCSFEKLDETLERLEPKTKKIGDMEADPIRAWYNKWVKENALGKVLDVGKSRYWDYGFASLDVNRKLNPTYVGNIEKTDFSNESFDTVLCNGMYESVDNPQAMIDEVVRLTKKGGRAIFGFVGSDYPPYRGNWKYYNFKEKIPVHDRVEFGKRYYFLICKK